LAVRIFVCKFASVQCDARTFIFASELRTDVELMDMKYKTSFSDKLRMVFLQLPYFTKEAEECKTLFDSLISYFWYRNFQDILICSEGWDICAISLLFTADTIKTLAKREKYLSFIFKPEPAFSLCQ